MGGNVGKVRAVQHAADLMDNTTGTNVRAVTGHGGTGDNAHTRGERLDTGRGEVVGTSTGHHTLVGTILANVVEGRGPVVGLVLADDGRSALGALLLLRSVDHVTKVGGAEEGVDVASNLARVDDGVDTGDGEWGQRGHDEFALLGVDEGGRGGKSRHGDGSGA